MYFGALSTNPLVYQVKTCRFSRKSRKIQNGGQNWREKYI